MEIYFNIEEKRERKLREKLLSFLKNQCKANGFEIKYEDFIEENVAGMCSYIRTTNVETNQLIKIEPIVIRILTMFRNEPAILAHGLGHYLSAKERNSSTEDEADEYGYKLCCQALTEKEQKHMKIFLSCFFEKAYKEACPND
jgi:hypothetical protein